VFLKGYFITPTYHQVYMAEQSKEQAEQESVSSLLSIFPERINMQYT
jgi:hypothetical protein